ERLITKAKRGDLHARRQVLAVLSRKDIVHTLFTEIAPSMAERHGGYTRITKIGPREGGNAPTAAIERVTEPARRRPAPVQAAEGESAASAESAESADSPDPGDPPESAESAESAETAESTETAESDVSAASAEEEDTKESESQ